MKMEVTVAYIWVGSFVGSALLGFGISAALCFWFPEFFAGLATPSGHMPSLEAELQSLFVGSAVLTVVFTLLIGRFLTRWLFAAPKPKESRGGWWPSPKV